MLNHVVFMSQNHAELLEPHDRYAMVSIRSPNMEVRLKRGWRNLHISEFNDIDKPFKPWKLFDENQADQIIAFIENLPDEVETLIVHCEAGISRSAAVALFANDYYASSLSLNKDSSCYNRHVRSLLEKRYHGC